MEMFEGTDPTVWVFVGLLVVAAFALGLLVDAGSGVIALYRWHRRRVERKASPAERLAAVAQAVDPHDSGDRFDIYPATDDPPRDERRIVPDSRREAEPARDDDPPDGGAPLAATAVQPRYDWAHLRGEKLEPPGPWRERARPLFDAVARFRRRRPDVRLAWSVLAALPPLRRWLLQRLTSGVHRARHAASRGAASWDDTRAVLSARWYRERQEAARNTQELILHARQSTGRSRLPRTGCVPW